MSQATASVTAVGFLLDSAGNPVANESITINNRVSGATTFAPFVTATTGADGSYSASGTVNAPDSYDFQAVFDGDSSYRGSTAEFDNVAVVVGTSLTLTVTQQ